MGTEPGVVGACAGGSNRLYEAVQGSYAVASDVVIHISVGAGGAASASTAMAADGAPPTPLPVEYLRQAGTGMSSTLPTPQDLTTRPKGASNAAEKPAPMPIDQLQASASAAPQSPESRPHAGGHPPKKPS